jgi:hypothetical protein
MKQMSAEEFAKRIAFAGAKRLASGVAHYRVGVEDGVNEAWWIAAGRIAEGAHGRLLHGALRIIQSSNQPAPGRQPVGARQRRHRGGADLDLLVPQQRLYHSKARSTLIEGLRGQVTQQSKQLAGFGAGVEQRT